MERIPADIGPTARAGGAERRRGLRVVVDAMVDVVRFNRLEEARARFERTSEDAFGLRRVRLATRPAGGVGISRDGVEWSLPLVGETAAIVAEPGARFAATVSPEVLTHWAGLASLALELERFAAGPAKPVPPRNWELVGRTPPIQRVRALMTQVARTTFPVLVEGESGVGKEVVARLLHEQGRRARGPFVAVNCAAIVDSLLEAELFGIEDRTATGVRGRRGKFEQADGGTLFLDEIGDLSAAAQAKLLRVLQDFTVERVGGHTPVAVNVRVIAATNRSLGDLVKQGRFRMDLFYRLNGVEIRVPPLRERLDDVPLLVDHIVARHPDFGRPELSPDALAALTAYHWPGNVRELERAVERAIALSSGRRIELGHLPPAVTVGFEQVFAPALEARSTLRQFAARYARLVLARSGNKREACRALDISHHTLDSYLRRCDLPEGAADEAAGPVSGAEDAAAAWCGDGPDETP